MKKIIIGEKQIEIDNKGWLSIFDEFRNEEIIFSPVEIILLLKFVSEYKLPEFE